MENLKSGRGTKDELKLKKELSKLKEEYEAVSANLEVNYLWLLIIDSWLILIIIRSANLKVWSQQYSCHSFSEESWL